MLIFKKLTVFWEKNIFVFKADIKKIWSFGISKSERFLKSLKKKTKKYLKDNLGIFKILIFQ